MLPGMRRHRLCGSDGSDARRHVAVRGRPRRPDPDLILNQPATMCLPSGGVAGPAPERVTVRSLCHRNVLAATHPRLVFGPPIGHGPTRHTWRRKGRRPRQRQGLPTSDGKRCRSTQTWAGLAGRVRYLPAHRVQASSTPAVAVPACAECHPSVRRAMAGWACAATLPAHRVWGMPEQRVPGASSRAAMEPVRGRRNPAPCRLAASDSGVAATPHGTPNQLMSYSPVASVQNTTAGLHSDQNLPMQRRRAGRVGRVAGSVSRPCASWYGARRVVGLCRRSMWRWRLWFRVDVMSCRSVGVAVVLPDRWPMGGRVASGRLDAALRPCRAGSV